MEKADLFNELRQEAGVYKIDITKGGRFYHLISKGQDKGAALIKTKEIYRFLFQSQAETIGLGDGENDFPMLSSCDYPVLIPTPDGEYHNTSIPDHIKAPYPGPRGWHWAIRELVQ